MPQLTVAIVVVNGLFAFAQEHRAERAAERLRDLLPRLATVVRDGQPTTVDASELVVGDLVLLEARAFVAATGGHTRLASIAHLTRAGQRPPSPLALELQTVVRSRCPRESRSMDHAS
jgi:magnesium-transporting ATPase (P-type)